MVASFGSIRYLVWRQNNDLICAGAADWKRPESSSGQLEASVAANWPQWVKGQSVAGEKREKRRGGRSFRRGQSVLQRSNALVVERSGAARVQAARVRLAGLRLAWAPERPPRVSGQSQGPGLSCGRQLDDSSPVASAEVQPVGPQTVAQPNGGGGHARTQMSFESGARGANWL